MLLALSTKIEIIQHLALRSAHTRALVPATRPPKSLHEETGRRDLSHVQFTRSVRRNRKYISINIYKMSKELNAP